MEKIYYFDTYEDDVVKSKNQGYKLKGNYKWIHKNIFYRFFSWVIYYIFMLVSLVYCKLILKVTVKNKKVLKKAKNFFVYSNHTQELGDVFNPLLILFPKRPYAVCSAANLGIPVLGKVLPMLGGIVIPDDIHSMMKFNDAVSYYARKHPIVIYPEAHLWPYYTDIRPFTNTSFTYPIKLNLPCFVFTTTYQKGKKKPKITIYIDGPYYPNNDIPLKEARNELHDKIYKQMKERNKNSNFEFITYKKRT